MAYKNEEIKIGSAATDAEILEMKNVLKPLMPPDSNMNFEKVTKAAMMKTQKVKEFFEKHVKDNHYAFQIKKCNDSNCEYHAPVRASEEFKNLKWLPMPTLNSSGNYKSFDETYGDAPTDIDRPGRAKITNKPKQLDWQISTFRARMIIKCTECEFPRILYSKLRLSPLDTELLTKYFETDPFTCASLIPSDEIGLQQDVLQHHGNYCKGQVSKHYYQLQSMANYQLICSVCLDDDVRTNKGPQPKCDSCIESSQKIERKRKRQ